MCGGKGTRLAPLTHTLPKPMLPVAGRPILERILLHLVGGGITRVFLAVNYLANVIEEHFGDGTQFGAEVSYLREQPESPLGTGGALGLLGKQASLPDPVLVVNGDLITQFSIADILDHHEASKAVATIAVRKHTYEVPYGVVIAGGGGYLTGMTEKPLHSWLINAGIYVLDPSLFDRVPPHSEYPLTDLLETMCLKESVSPSGISTRSGTTSAVSAIFPRSWRTMSLTGRTVLVTGADGFIGSHLAERLTSQGACVRALCLYNSRGSNGWLDDSEVRDEMEIVLGDIRDPSLMREVVSGVEIVFHLAALIAIPYSYVAPASYVETNVCGTLNMLEAARACHVQRFVQTSTSEVYGNAPQLPIHEASPLRAQSPYSATKIAADKLCEAYALSFGLPVTILRPFNTYGPRQSRRAVIPTILTQLLRGSPSVNLGSLEPQRDYTYVSDTVDGFVRAATVGSERYGVVQLGSGQSISVADLFALCRDVVGSDATVTVDPQRSRPPSSEIDILLSDPRRAEEVLGWTPTVSLRLGIERTAAWLLDHADIGDADDYVR